MEHNRIGLIIWVKNPKDTRGLEKHGHVLYVSRKMKYVVMYVNRQEVPQKLKVLQRLPYVNKVELSHRHEVATEYNLKAPEEA